MTRLLIVVLLIATMPVFAQVANSPFTLDEYPITDGSTSARPIARAVFLEIFGVPWERTPQPSRSIYSSPPEDEIQPADPGTMPEDVRVGYERIADHSGTHEAYDRLTNFRIIEDAPSLIFECRCHRPTNVGSRCGGRRSSTSTAPPSPATRSSSSCARTAR
jgi:hypothetical protein